MTSPKPKNAAQKAAGRFVWTLLIVGAIFIAIATFVFALKVVFALMSFIVLVIAVLALWWFLKRRGSQRD